MRRIMLFIFLLVFGYGCYILYLKKGRYLFKRSNSEVTEANETLMLRKQLAKAQEDYEYLLKLCSADSTGSDPSDSTGLSQPDTLTESLNRQISELRAENLELRREIDQRKSTIKPNNKTANPRKNNEKNIPIARNSSAVELQKFLTELYGDR